MNALEKAAVVLIVLAAFITLLDGPLKPLLPRCPIFIGFCVK